MKRPLLFLFICILLGLIMGCSSLKSKPAKYIFYFIGDGMGVNQVNGAEMYFAELEGRIGKKSFTFSQFPVINFMTTFSSHNSVTCSAAAGTALACGIKTKNGTIGMDSLKNPVKSIAVVAKEKGKKTGVISSVGINHATPAAFYAHQPSRSMYDEITLDIPASGVDFLGGGGIIPSSGSRLNPQALADSLEQGGYVIYKGVEEIRKNSDFKRKAILTPDKEYSKQSLPYAIDRQPEDMTLKQITDEAIRYLSHKSPEGFFLMVEGGKIDWACHDNDAATTFQEISDLSESIESAIRFYQKYPKKTLIVITADHETGGLGLGTGSYSLNLQALKNQKLSKDGLTEKIKKLRMTHKAVSWEQIKNLFREELGFWEQVKITSNQEKSLREVYEKTFHSNDVEMEENLYSSHEPIVREAIAILNAISKVSWASGGHSAGVVPVYAIGAGSELFQGSLDNIDIPRKIGEAMEGF